MSRRDETMLKGVDLRCLVTVSLGYTELLVSLVARILRRANMNGVAPQNTVLSCAPFNT